MVDQKHEAVGEQQSSPRDEPPLLLDPVPSRVEASAWPKEALSIAVFSQDRTLIETVEQAAGGRFSLLLASSWQELLQHIERGECSIILLDVDLVTDTVERRIAELRGLVPHPVVVAASPRTEAEALIGMLSEGAIYRLLIKPPALGSARLLLESAAAKWLDLAGATPPAQRRQRPSSQWARAALRKPVVRNALLTGASAALIGVLAWFGTGRNGLSERDDAPRAAAVPAGVAAGAADFLTGDEASAASPIPADPLIQGLLERARAAAAAGRLAEPPGDNALDHYLAILRIEPEHRQAAAEVDRLLEAPFAQAEEALLAGAIQDAAVVLDRIRRIRPDSSRLRFLDSQLQQAGLLRESADAGRAAERGPNAAVPASELESLLVLAEARLRRGQLLAPAGDSAKIYIERAIAIAPEDPAVVALRMGISEAVLAAAHALIDDGNIERADALLGEAAALDADSQGLRQANAALAELREAARQRQLAEWLRSAVDRLDGGQLILPEQDSALYYLSLARSQNPNAPGLAAPWQRLLTAIAAEAGLAIDERRWSDAERWIDALRTAEASDRRVEALTHAAYVARTQERYLQVAVPASDLTLLAGESPEYPEPALRSNVEGWVEIEFVVDRDGLPRDIAVLAAEPPGRFEAAALAAVASYRFAPFSEEGITYERRASIRIRFALE